MHDYVCKEFLNAPTFGKALIDLMKGSEEYKGITNEALAYAIKVSYNMVSQYRNDRARPSIDVVIRLIRLFRLHPLIALSFASLAGYDITIPSPYNMMIFDKLYDTRIIVDADCTWI